MLTNALSKKICYSQNFFYGVCVCVYVYVFVFNKEQK